MHCASLFVHTTHPPCVCILQLAPIKASSYAKDPVISASAAALSSSKPEEGIPTLEQLRDLWENDKVLKYDDQTGSTIVPSLYRQCREANFAMGPVAGLGQLGQAWGAAVALVFPRAVITKDKTSWTGDRHLSEISAALVKRDLVEAVTVASDLEPKVKFIIKDWLDDAAARAAADQATKVMRARACLINLKQAELTMPTKK